jgi:hypothetical protein
MNLCNSHFCSKISFVTTRHTTICSLRRAVAFTRETIGLDAPHIALKDAGATYEMKRTDSGTGEPPHSWLAVSREKVACNDD